MPYTMLRTDHENEICNSSLAKDFPNFTVNPSLDALLIERIGGRKKLKTVYKALGVSALAPPDPEVDAALNKLLIESMDERFLETLTTSE